MTEQEFTDKAEPEFNDTADDVAKAFKTSTSAVYRMAREKKLPPGTYAYLNQRTLRFDLPRIKRVYANGGASERSRGGASERSRAA